MFVNPFSPGGASQQAVLEIDGSTFELKRPDIWALPKFVASLMKTTGQSWKQIVTETPLNALLVLMEAWNLDEPQPAELDIDKAMQQQEIKIGNKREKEVIQFLLNKGLRFKDG